MDKKLEYNNSPRTNSDEKSNIQNLSSRIGSIETALNGQNGVIQRIDSMETSLNGPNGIISTLNGENGVTQRIGSIETALNGQNGIISTLNGQNGLLHRMARIEVEVDDIRHELTLQGRTIQRIYEFIRRNNCLMVRRRRMRR